MNSHPEATHRCPRTHIQHRWIVPGGLPPDGPAPWALFFINGIGLDLDGFGAAMQTLRKAPATYPYRDGYHVVFTVPGFEDGEDASTDGPLGMTEQAQRVAVFMEEFLAGHPALEVILYGFSYGSDLAVEVLACLGTRLPLTRVILTEMNVHLQSCFITSRITAAYAAARVQGPSRNREAHKGFVSRVVKASAEGRLSAGLMEDMAQYFRTIARKNWAQLAQSAKEASDQPEIRVARLLEITANSSTRFDLIFSDPDDLRIFQRRLETWGGALGQIRLLDSTSHEHFHHLSGAGVLENLGGRLREAGPRSSLSS
jgi:pimeloyl-ACP methyl ester carboxylesterase